MSGLCPYGTDERLKPSRRAEAHDFATEYGFRFLVVAAAPHFASFDRFQSDPEARPAFGRDAPT